MRKLLMIVLFCFSFYSGIKAQDSSNYNIENRKGNLFFKLGSEYRITPIIKRGSTFTQLEAVNVEAQNSGIALHYSLDYYITKNLSLSFANSFRYDEIISNFPQGTSTTSTPEQSLILGFHFYVDYHFTVFEGSEFFVRVGRSLLNRGTKYIQEDIITGTDGSPLSIGFSELDSAFEPWNFGLGWKKNRFEIISGMYTSANTDYTNVERMAIPYFRVSYNLGKLW